MKILRNPAILFGLASIPVSLPIAWFFWGLDVPANTLGAHIWRFLPVIAAVLSSLAAFLLSRTTEPSSFGPWRGVLAALIALVGCAAIAHPILVLPALVFVAWFVLPLGGLVGWLIGRRVSPNNSFKPNPLRGSA
jgi:hypothetical protein